MDQQQMILPHVDRPELPEIFADSINQISFTNGVLRMDLIVQRMAPQTAGQPMKGRTYTAARIAITAHGALQLHASLTGMLDLLEKQGQIQRSSVVPPAVPHPKH